MGSAYFDAHSLWQQTDKPLFTTLRQNLHCDTCIVGGGIAGLSVAYELLRAGQSVVVIDRERLGLGETGLSSAHLSNALDSHYHNLERWHGASGARLAQESHAAAIDWFERLQNEEQIACDFRRVDGYLYSGPSGSPAELQRELEAARRAGINDINLVTRAPFDFASTGPALRFGRQAQINPTRFLDGLATAVKRLGGQIFTHTEASEVRGGRPAVVRTGGGAEITCDAVVVATNSPIINWLTIHAKNAAHRTYVIGLPIKPEDVRPALLWDTADPYHYVRFVKDPIDGRDLILIGGEDHRTGQESRPEQHFVNLQRWAASTLGLPQRPVTRWSGQIMETLDGLAYIGRNPGDRDNVYIVTGDCGHGLTHGAIAGQVLRDMILGQANPWATLYDPSRLHLRNIPAFMRDAVESSVAYGDWLSEGDVNSIDEIERGQGAVVRQGLSKIAVYRDDVGAVHRCSAVCPHLGGLVRWNSAEKTWDCPCHGSRFDRYGAVVNGPAIHALESVSDTVLTNLDPVF